MSKEIKNNNKTFDCIKMKNEIRARIYQHIKNMTFLEQKEFMRKVISGELKLN